MSIEDDIIKHKILLQRLTGAQASIMLSVVKQAEKLAIKAINAGVTNFKELKIKVDKLIKSSIDESISALVDIAEYEEKFVKKLLKKHKKEVTTEDLALAAIIASLLMPTSLNKEGLKIKKSYEKLASEQTNDIIQLLRDTVTKKASDRVDSINMLVNGKISTQTKTLAGTSINRVSTAVALLTYKASDVKRVQWIATLDGTCPYCESLHSTVFDVKDIILVCPAHVNCRCELVPYGD